MKSASTAKKLDEVIGIKRVKAIHLNDSYFPCGCRKDRHQHIAKGYIGIKGFRAILNHPDLRNIPMILETPKDGKYADRRNLKTVRKLGSEEAKKSLS